MKTAFLEALISSQRAPELADVDDVFGWLIGSWEVEAVLHDGMGGGEKRRGEVHASWVLEGRAIQDLFIFPSRADRASGLPASGDRYATTIRTYDRTLGAWRVNFINPAADETSLVISNGSFGFSVGLTRESCSNAKLLGLIPILDHFMIKNPPPPINY